MIALDNHKKIISLIFTILFVLTISAPTVASVQGEWSLPISGNSNSISISSDDSYVAIGSDTTVHILGMNGKTISESITEGMVYTLSASSNYVATGDESGNIYLYDKLGTEKYKIANGRKSITSVSVSNNGNIVASIDDGGSGYITFLDLSGASLWDMKSERGPTALAITPDGKNIVTTDVFKEEALQVDYDRNTGVQFEYYIDSFYTNSVCFLTDQGELLWDYYIGSKISSASINSNGNYIAASSGNKVYFFDDDGSLLWTWSNPAYSAIQYVNVFSDGKYVAAVSGNYIYVMDVDGELVDTWQIDSNIKLSAMQSDGTIIKLVGATDSNIVYYEYNFDYDADGLTNTEEEQIGTDPYKKDTDGDNLIDSNDPHPLEHEDKLIDSDKDGLNNYDEKQMGTDPYNDDSDGDGLSDNEDSNPLVNDIIDSDNDGWTDVFEGKMGTDPYNDDTDGDGQIDSLDSSPGSFEQSSNSGLAGLINKIMSLLGL